MRALKLPITTPRLTLREFAAGDAGALCSWVTNRAVMRYIFEAVETEEEARVYLGRAIGYQRRKPRDVWELAIQENSTGDLVGACNLTVMKPREGDLGYMFRCEAWGRGYATEAAGALRNAGFTDLKFERIIATVDPKNLASIRVLEKLGFQWEAHYRQGGNSRARKRQCHLYAMERAWSDSESTSTPP